MMDLIVVGAADFALEESQIGRPEFWHLLKAI